MPILSLKNKSAGKAFEKPVAPSSSATVVSSVVVRRKPKIEVFSAPQSVPNKKVKSIPPKPAPATKKPKKKPLPAAGADLRPRSERVAETLAILQVAFPHLLPVAEADLRYLWAIGLRTDLWEALKKRKAEGLFRSRALINEALALYRQQHPQYEDLLKVAGTPRIGMDGQVKGEVSEQEAMMATGPGTAAGAEPMS